MSNKLMRKKYSKCQIINICPVCGFDGLQEPPFSTNGYPSQEICSCCGFQFGFDDSSEGTTYIEYRLNWINEGYKFFDTDGQPKLWNYETMLNQLKNIEKVKHYEPDVIRDKKSKEE